MAALKPSSVYDQFLGYLAEKVTPTDILSFQASEKDQERLNELTEKNKSDSMLPEEAAELEELLAFNRLMTLLKTRACKLCQG